MCMKRIHPFALLISLLAVLTFASCRSEEPFRHLTIADSPEMFSTVHPLRSRVGDYVTDSISYYITFDDEKKVASLTISHLQISPDGMPVTATFTDIPWNYQSGSHETRRVIKTESLHSSGGPGADILLTDVTIVYIEANDTNVAQTAGFYAQYTVENAFTVMSYPYTLCADGTTAICEAIPGAERDYLYDPVYIIKLDPKTMSADITVRNFVTDGVIWNLELKSLALTLTPDGYALRLESPVSVNVGDTGRILNFESVEANAIMGQSLELVSKFTYQGKRYLLEGYLTPEMSTLR